LRDAARLAAAFAEAPGIAGSGVLLSLADARVTVRLSRDIFAIAARRDAIDVGFWRAALGYIPMAEDNAIDSLGHGSTVWMQELDQAKPLRHAMHIDVSVAREQVEARLAAAVAAGGRIVDDSHAPSHWTLADRAGNRVCICAWPDGAATER
jgi:4a-hydroxytetrahydrobiopterin dehydratase